MAAMLDGEALRKWRMSVGLSHGKLGKMVGAQAKTIGYWEAGRYQPQKGKLEKLNKIMADYDAGKRQKETKAWDNNKSCKGCIYLGEQVKSCDYFLITGKRRPCPPGEGCTAKHCGKKGHTRPFEMRAHSTRFHRMVPATERDPRILELYEAGKTDAEISRETEHSISAIYNWRKRHNYQTNYNHNKGIKTGKRSGRKDGGNDKGTGAVGQGAGGKQP